MQSTEYLKLQRFRGLDGIRCLAILAVIWHHSPHPQFMPLLARGFFGVDLFFIMSGFLISTLLIREKARSGRISLKNFWARRFLRLAPAYYFMLIALAGAYLVLKPEDDDTRKLIQGLPVYFLYLSNWINPGAPNLGPTWSLATEEQFYLVWPLVEAFATPIGLAAIWVCALVANQFVNFNPGDLEILQVTFTPILLGVGLAHVLNRPDGFAAVQRLVGWKGAGWICGAALLAVLAIPGDIAGLPRLTAHILGTAVIASLLLRPGGAMTRLLEQPVLRYIGLISYGMYLYHMFCLHAARPIAEKTGIPAFIIGVALTVLVASVSFSFLEKPFLNLRKRFRSPQVQAADPLSLSAPPR